MKLILASNSPRRRYLLDKENIKYAVYTKDIHEDWEISFSPLSTALSLAYQKGYSVAEEFPEKLVLSADTIVVLEDKIIGKPKDRKDAKHILNELSGKLHQVVTAFSLIAKDANIKYINYGISYVKFKKLTEMDINAYLDIDEPYDKAGAYAIQGVGSKFVDYYEGEYDNIIGLPSKKVMTAINILIKEL